MSMFIEHVVSHKLYCMNVTDGLTDDPPKFGGICLVQWIRQEPSDALHELFGVFSKRYRNIQMV